MASKNIGHRELHCWFPTRPGGLAIDVGELIENNSNSHSRMPSMDAGIGQHLKCIIDTCIECREASTLDILHWQEIVLLAIERRVNGGLFRPGQRS